ncbi:MAG: hypothetical protein KA257_02535 [Opitutaceae bacterium]|nr:hypothetical protein [Opitutaceae bacterium]
MKALAWLAIALFFTAPLSSSAKDSSLDALPSGSQNGLKIMMYSFGIAGSERGLQPVATQFTVWILAQNKSMRPVTIPTLGSLPQEIQGSKLKFEFLVAEILDGIKLMPSATELHLVTLEPGQLAVRAVSNVHNASMEPLSAVFSVDEDLKEFFPDIWTGEITLTEPSKTTTAR